MSRTPYARPHKPLKSDMNVVPYIDVMLVLLIIFMVTAPMLTTGVEVDLPKEKTNTLASKEHLPVIISMKKDGSLFLSKEGVVDAPMDIDALVDELQILANQSRDAAGNITLQVMINADANNPYSNIVQVMARLQQVGISKVGLLSDAPK